jgi:hypothetical protein
MKHPTKRSRRQLSLSLEREGRHDLTPDQESALLLALADLLIEALGEALPSASPEPGERHEP